MIITPIVVSMITAGAVLHLKGKSDHKKQKVVELTQELSINSIDPNSFSRPDLTRVSHIQWTASVNFKKHIIEGSVDLTVDKVSENSNELILDTSELTIGKVKDKESDEKLLYELSPTVKTFGAKLVINLPPKNRTIVSISYKTSRKATGLQWLSPKQTAGKKHPYLFSHCQAIHCRSLLPCQDTPTVKATYSATITVPKDLVVLMSAVGEGSGNISDFGRSIQYKFNQKIPIPSYLIAIAVGDLVLKEIGPRTHVWSEQEFLERSVYEFADTEKMLATAESIVGPYVWETFDLLILPPSFPYGVMENPCNTFVTPTILVGDSSLTNVIAHGIAHSWTGNLVTNQNLRHFWLNEGFSTFLERKILGRLSGGEPNRQFRAIEGLKALKLEIQELGADNPLTKMLIDPRGIDPEEVSFTIAGEKGHTFLFFLEQKLGGPKIFEPFLKAYIDKFKYKSIDTKDFKEFLFEYFKDKKKILDEIDWNGWMNSPGMPSVIPNYDKTLTKKCTELTTKWVSADDNEVERFFLTDLSSMDSWQIIEFLNQLLETEPQISQKKFDSISQIYDFKSNKNPEILSLWIRLGLKVHSKSCVEAAIKFITSQGRMKFLQPIYRALYAWEETRKLAIDTFIGQSKGLMTVSASIIAKELHITHNWFFKS